MGTDSYSAPDDRLAFRLVFRRCVRLLGRLVLSLGQRLTSSSFRRVRPSGIGKPRTLCHQRIALVTVLRSTFSVSAIFCNSIFC